MPLFDDLLGTIATRFRIGLQGVNLRTISNQLAIRNTADSADAPITAATINLSGDSFIINSDAVGTGTDRTYTLARPLTGVAANLSLTLPPTAGSPGQVISTDGAGNLTFVAVGGSSDKMTTDTTSIAFGSTSPIALFTLPANAVVQAVRVYVDTVFNGTPSLSIGITGTTSKYTASNQVDLLTATIYRIYPGLVPIGTTENLIATYSAGSATVGAGRIEFDYVIPS